MYCRRKNLPAAYCSERVHKRADHSERLRGAHSAKAVVTAHGLYRHERKSSRDQTGGAALDICFCFSGHRFQLLFERLHSYYLHISLKNDCLCTGKWCYIFRILPYSYMLAAALRIIFPWVSRFCDVCIENFVLGKSKYIILTKCNF